MATRRRMHELADGASPATLCRSCATPQARPWPVKPPSAVGADLSDRFAKRQSAERELPRETAAHLRRILLKAGVPAEARGRIRGAPDQRHLLPGETLPQVQPSACSASIMKMLESCSKAGRRTGGLGDRRGEGVDRMSRNDQVAAWVGLTKLPSR